MAESAQEIKKHVKLYWIVFSALAVLTVVTVSASHLEVGVAMGVFIAMIIAVTKGSLVASCFMHLLFDKNKTIGALLLLCLVFFAALMLLPTLMMLDSPGKTYVP